MVLTVFKHGSNWDLLDRIFKIKGQTFGRLIMYFTRLIGEEFYRLFVFQIRENYNMKVLGEK